MLTDLQGATFDNNSGTGTIINAEPLAISISDATATEGVDATMDFTVTLNRATNRTVTVSLLFSSGTADFSDIEYVQTEQSVTFAPGETEKTYSIGIVDDTVNEPSETFDIVVQSPVSTDLLILADSVGKGTILNTETLTGSFENVPQDHDGSTAFTFNVAFTTDVSIGYAAMRDHAFTVTNGDVTGAARVDGRSDRWLITVDPGRRRRGDDHPARQPGLRDSGGHLLEGGAPGSAEQQSLGHGRDGARGRAAHGELLERAQQPRRRGLLRRPDLQRGSRRRL